MKKIISNIYSDILDTIGNTPLLRINNTVWGISDGVRIFAKLEMFNPGGSVKDRAAYGMIRDAEDNGALTKDKIILDSTSGNTGIAYAMISAVKGYKARIVLPENASSERKTIISGFGAEIVYSSPFEGSDGAIKLAKEIYDSNPKLYFMPDQYNNPSNPKAHFNTTGPEIIRQTKGEITHFIAATGTTGTIMGTGRRLKEYNREIQVIAIEPDNSMHGLEGLKFMAESIVPGIYDTNFPDKTVFVNTEDAYDTVKKLAIDEGLAVGHSSGAALTGALSVAKEIEQGTIVTIFPDGGDRYLSHEI